MNPSFPQQNPQQVVVNVQQAAPSQALPAICNVFCFPGLGQLIQGRLLAAMLFWFAWMVSLALCAVFVGFVTTPIIYLWAIIDAAKYRGDSESGIGVGPALGIGAVLLAVPVAGVVALFALGMLASATSEHRNRDYTQQVAQPPAVEMPAVASELSEVREAANTETIETATPEVAVADTDDNYRLWTDATGKFKVLARFMEATDSEVQLEKDDGKIIKVPLGKLSPEDQKFLMDRKKD